jgi:hypothetical protein
MASAGRAAERVLALDPSRANAGELRTALSRIDRLFARSVN